MMKLRTMGLALTLCSALFTGLASQANAANRDTQTQTIHTEVTTKGTEWNGKRHSATSDWTTFTAPAGYVIVEKEVQTAWKGRNGSENRVDVTFDDYVEIVPGTGIKQPRTVRIRSHARSPRHHHGARGWTKADVIVRQVKFQ